MLPQNDSAGAESVAKGDPSHTVDPTACMNCGAPVEEGYRASLCSDCRDKLAARPIPPWMRLATVLILVPVVMSMERFPKALSVALALARGERAEVAGSPENAIAHYNKVLEVFPGSSHATMRRCIVLIRAHLINEIPLSCRVRPEGVSDEVWQELEQASVALVQGQVDSLETFHNTLLKSLDSLKALDSSSH